MSGTRRDPVIRRAAAPLLVGAADDLAERQADRVADEVIARLQGQDGTESAVPGHDHDHDPVHRSHQPSGETPEVGFAGGELSPDLSARIEGARGSGSALPAGVRSRLETGFGASLASVRVHHGEESARLNRSVSARAFTTGNDIFFGAGEFRPATPDGERVLAHEIAHTQQQGSGARRTTIRRRWNVKSSKFTLDDGIDVRTQVARPIWFVKDSDGDEMVVKSEDQPTGLGQLAASLHKHLSKIRSVDQVKLDMAQRKRLNWLIDVRTDVTTVDPNWAARGALLKQGKGYHPTDDPVQAAKDDAETRLLHSPTAVIAMSFAEGTEASDLAQPVANAPEDETKSAYRTLLMNANHVRMLGKMTAIDAFFGNQDRLMNGNMGNWFFDPQAGITLLDSVDPGNGDRQSAKAGFATGSAWDTGTTSKKAAGPLFADKKRGTKMVNELAIALLKAKWDKPTGLGGDARARTWLTGAHPDGGTRREFVRDRLEEGFKEGQQRILKVFASTRWSLGKGSKHAAKKSIRSAAKKAGVEDATTGYYDELKRRATWIQNNAV